MSNWQRVLKVAALCPRLKSRLASREVKLTRQVSSESIRPLPKVSVTFTELHAAEKEFLKVVQREHFHEEIEILKGLKVVGELTARKVARERNLAIKKSSCYIVWIHFLMKMVLSALVAASNELTFCLLPTADSGMPR